MNRWTYILCIVGGGVLAAAFVALGMDRKRSEMLFAVPIPLVLAAILHMVMIYKMWNSIYDEYARTSPGKAVGLMFVPLFNLYWIFQVFPGFATDFNEFRTRYRVPSQRLSSGLLVAYILCSPIPLVGWIVQSIAISRICTAANAARQAWDEE